ncbi:MAG: glycine--tRNA ligase subunit alpha, partial [Betaproteobacteria bacterium]|nr:glycine--tRNA ligase subunit alpha [Betaproteobacteria bacterium]
MTPSFQDIILRLQAYWSEQGCALLQALCGGDPAPTARPATAAAKGVRHLRAAVAGQAQ